MHNSAMQAWLDSSHFAGANAPYIEELYEAYLDNPDSVAGQWRSIFDQLPR